MFIRTAGERDLAAIRALLVETWHATYDAIYGVERVTAITDDWHSIASLKARLTRPNSEFLVADDGKRIGGTAFAAATTDAKIIMLNQLYVHPACQRQGIGQALLEEVEASFPEAQTLRVEVEEANTPAVAFYRSRGFLPASNTADCGGSSGLPALILEKPLG
ncbi:GNAT family N-acetyltransferase [Mesorhizobium sp.]|uniref:GNAT family N-acetyltransferase n=1 Tax=Mesorhizobium sp. TaxID=1871066 RepID=UPI0012206D95|nr:GNAT family N-acetyltransferase [Mesorhizobium sp.]TIS58264.1 MAG: GNAT family N-acetyltransferase [Mesorhizobium sp.]TIS92783.1 MAG: GNAT family N-acetyltransferase [Mesorhizobium sp.]